MEDYTILPLMLSNEELEVGDAFLWRSGIDGRYKVHSFHSDAGYGIKTFTLWDKKDGSSLLVNHSGYCGKIVPVTEIKK